MVLELGDFKILTDDRQYIVQKKKIVEAGPMTKPENVGNEVWVDEAYCRTLEYSLKHVGEKIVMKYDEPVTIVKELRKLRLQIKEFVRLMELGEEIE